MAALAEDDSPVELGFVEAVDSGFKPSDTDHPSDRPVGIRPAIESLDSSGWDGGKVGGLPVWLQVRYLTEGSVSSLPKPSTTLDGFDLSCTHCSAPLALLAELYAPVEADALESCSDPSDVTSSNPNRAFHRMLYLFGCVAGGAKCINRPAGTSPSVLALRFQASEEAAVSICADPLALCAVCGLPASAKCSRCKAVVYCCKQHQALHWKGGHKGECGAGSGLKPSEGKSDDDDDDDGSGSSEYARLPRLLPCALEGKAVLPEFELVVEPEPDARTRAARAAVGLSPELKAAILEAKRNTHQTPTTANSSDSSGAAASGTAGSGDASDEEIAIASADLSDVTQRNLAKWTGSHLLQDRRMVYFERRTACEPAQVVRYCRWPEPKEADAEADAEHTKPVKPKDGEGQAAGGDDDQDGDDDDDDDEETLSAAPLWVSDKHRPSTSSSCRFPPPCERCGASRRFEFQLMPQVIAQLAASPAISPQASKALLADLDFGTIAVYTCTNSCDSGSGGGGHGHSYSREAVWVQPTDDETEARELRERTMRLLSEGIEQAEAAANVGGKQEPKADA